MSKVDHYRDACLVRGDWPFVAGKNNRKSGWRSTVAVGDNCTQGSDG